MAVPINFLINSPHESSDEEYSDFEIITSEDESMEEELPELENTNGGSRSSLSSLEREVTVTETEANDAEDEFWFQYPYLKELVAIVVSDTHQDIISEKDAYERIKLIGDEKAKELNEAWKALCIKEQNLCVEMLDLFASTMKSGNR